MSEGVVLETPLEISKEKTGDERAIEQFLTDIFESPDYMKTLSSYGYWGRYDTRRLTPAQQKLLFSEEYLNVKPGNAQDKEHTTPYGMGVLTRMPRLRAKQWNGKTWEILATTSRHYSSREDEREGAGEFMRQLLDKVEKRRATIWRNIERDREIGDKVFEEKAPFVWIMAGAPQSVDTWLNLEIYLRYTAGDPLDANWRKQVEEKIEDLKRLEREAGEKLTIGLEVEVPYTGKKKELPSKQRYVAFMEHLELFKRLKMPIEEDKQGEFALPYSSSVDLQLELLDQLHKSGYLPINYNRETDLWYTLHVNIGIPVEVADRLSSLTQEKINRLMCLMVMFGLVYSHPDRLRGGAYVAAAIVHSSRIEIRNQQYNPADDNRQIAAGRPEDVRFVPNRAKLEEIRAVMVDCFGYLLDKGENGELLGAFLDSCYRRMAEVVPDLENVLSHETKRVTEQLLDNNQVVGELRKMYVGYLENRKK